MSPRSKIRAGKCRGGAAVTDPVTGVVAMRIDGENLELIEAGAQLRCAFRDTTVGNNGAQAAAPRWDACTGPGSPIGQQLLRTLSGDAQTKVAGC
jgi:hypothetical protein